MYVNDANVVVLVILMSINKAWKCQTVAVREQNERTIFPKKKKKKKKRKKIKI